MKLIDILEKLDLNGTHKQGTDKHTKHSYLEVYESLFEDYRVKKNNILEVGIMFGASSLLWQKYFEFSKITLIDIEYQITEKIKSNLNWEMLDLHIIDAYKEESLNLFKDKKFDIIMDDGPHTIESQLFLIKNYTSLLNNDGILIIEDIQDINSVEEFQKILPNDCYLFTYDLREIKKRYDDIIVVIKKKKSSDINLNICYPVYNNQRALDYIKDKLSNLPCKKFIVDDGSDIPLVLPEDENFHLTRIERKRDWNQGQANNIAIRNSESKVILRMDIDHYIEPQDYVNFLKLSMTMKEKTIYQFQRFRVDTQQYLNQGCNIIMIKKEDFNLIGQYDERFCGHYGYEDLEFQIRATNLGYSIETYPLVVYVDARNKTIGMTRDTTVNKQLLEKIKSDYGDKNNRL